jgi:hypothetical protein
MDYLAHQNNYSIFEVRILEIFSIIGGRVSTNSKKTFVKIKSIQLTFIIDLKKWPKSKISEIIAYTDN